MLVALTNDQKLGLAGMAAIFIAFALISALLIPRYRPDFPGRKGVGLFVVLTLLLTVGMLGAVVVFAKEDHEAEAAGQEQTEVTTTETGQTTTETGGTTTQAEQHAGDAEAGKALFASNGCGGCHTYSAAGSNGAVGPNLDEVLKGKDAAFVHQAIVDPNAEIAPGYRAGIMPSFDQLSDEQVNDLVAFLTSG
ncbi:MAG TPA: cytochrome c [Gaiellaceae bacterium]|nr:cytochrome c [Gaiellaceae bacterium]